MFVVCQNSKCSFCQYGKRCDQIHFTDICALKQECREKYCCDKDILTYVTILKSLENANFKIAVSTCTWKVLKKLQKEIEILKTEILHLKIKNEKLERKITHVYENHFHKSGQTDDIVRRY